MNLPPKKSSKKMRGVPEVAVAISFFYLVLLVFGAKGLHHWADHLPDSPWTSELRTLAYKNWHYASLLGFEEPGLTVERWFLDAQEAPKLMYPRSFAEELAHQNKLRAAKLAPAKVSPIGPVAMGMEEIPAALRDGKKRGPRVLVLGDSLMLTVGPVVKKDIESKLGGVAWVKAKLGTGLARPDIFDWSAELKRVVSAVHFDYVVLMFGTNDSQDFYEQGELLSYGTDPWVKAYNKRLAALMDATCAGGSHGFWLGMPPMRTPSFARKMLRINTWVERQAAAHPCMQYLPTAPALSDEDGLYAGYLKIQDRLEKVRMIDGIHVTSKGGSLISSLLMELLPAAPQGAH